MNNADRAMRARLSGAVVDPRARAVLALHIRRLTARKDGSSPDDLLSQLTSEGAECSATLSESTVLQKLAARGLITLDAADGTFSIRPVGGDSSLWGSDLIAPAPLRLSRFTMIAREGSALTVRNPLSDRWFELHDPALAQWLTQFTDPAPAGSLPEVARPLIDGLTAAGMLLPCDLGGTTIEDRDPALRMWELHDLLMHTRSRRGRTAGLVGAAYEFDGQLGEIDALPAPLAVDTWLDLRAQPVADTKLSFTEVVERRWSCRDFAATPVPIKGLSAVLSVALGQRDARRRRYPNGGALYEQNFYLAVAGQPDLPQGLYRYDPEMNRLGRLAANPSDAAALLDDAATAMGVASRPPLLIIIASRFGRVRWKYGGLAYALQLKHVGVIQEALYLAAIAHGLGGCALGSGNSERFAQVTGLDYLREGSIGEFVLGVPENSERES